MKNIVLILLIGSFLAQCTSQFWILAAFKINQEYISANLCINRFDAIPVCKGACYLEDKLNKNQQQQQKFPDLKNKESTLFCQANSIVSIGPDIKLKGNFLYPHLKMSFITSDYMRSVFHPPVANI